MMKFRWLLLLPSFLSILLFSSPADAAKLLRWRFEERQNVLEFTTDGRVQPRALLMDNPLRLVIDLPGTTLGGPTLNQSVGGAIREIRVGQANDNTTRIVLELAPGYTIDPQQVRFRGVSPSRWLVQLPTPQRRGFASNQPSNESSSRPISSTVRDTSGTRLDSLQVTRDGFVILTRGGEPKNIEMRRSGDRRIIDFEVEGAVLSPSLSERSLPVNRYGVSQIQFSQAKTSPAVVRITMNLTEDSPDWEASFNRVGGIVILPQGTRAGQIGGASQDADSQVSESRLATIESVELTNNDTQLLIQADRSVRATNRWEARANAYQITIPDAQLAERLRGPQLGTSSPVSQVLVRQQNPRTVIVLVKPSPGTQVGELNQVSDRLLALQLRSSRSSLPSTGSISVPFPEQRRPSGALPRVPNSRVVVTIDPGHGGEDPGAIGIGGLREKDIVLPIALQVATLLERQGVQVVLTRSSDRFISLQGRVDIAQRTRSDLFVSIHANAISLNRPDVNGIETYYFSSGLRLAQTIHGSILQSVNTRDRRVRRARFYVLRKSSIPAVLVEVGFVTGAEDARNLASPIYQSQMAEAIARGILLYLQQNY